MYQSAFMNTNENDVSVETLQHIRSIMERSSRFISLSGWSGIWAGATALVGSFIAYGWLDGIGYTSRTYTYSETNITKFIVLAIALIIVAVLGGIYFTWRRVKRNNEVFWNGASRKLVVQMAIPLLAGGVFSLGFLYHDSPIYIPSMFLVFYGLALINASKYTVSDIRQLGLLEVLLGCICLFVPGYGLLFWTIGFGVLHILYGIFMWNKYDKKEARQ